MTLTLDNGMNKLLYLSQSIILLRWFLMKQCC